MRRNWYWIPILSLLPISWDIVWLWSRLSQGYHTVGGILIRFYVATAMPSFLNLVRLNRHPLISEPSLNTSRYIPHPPHLYLSTAPLLPHTTLLTAILAMVGWSVVQWVFVMILLHAIWYIPLVSWPKRWYGLVWFIVLNLVILAAQWSTDLIPPSLSRLLLAGLVIPLGLIVAKYFLVFFKFSLVAESGSLSYQWHQSQKRRHTSAQQITGWLIGAMAVSLLSALMANLSPAVWWVLGWLIIIDIVYVWLLVLLANYYRQSKVG